MTWIEVVGLGHKNTKLGVVDHADSVPGYVDKLTQQNYLTTELAQGSSVPSQMTFEWLIS